MPQTKNEIPCKVAGCPRVGVVAKGLCATHYQRQRRTGRLDTTERNHEQSPWCTVEGCDRPLEAKGLCRMHYERQRRGGTDMRPEPLPTSDESPREFIEARCTMSDGHLLWGGRMRGRLPVVRMASKPGVDLSLRRLWWELNHGEIEASTYVRNACGESRCLTHLVANGHARQDEPVTSR